jgi:hypothetical protein
LDCLSRGRSDPRTPLLRCVWLYCVHGCAVLCRCQKRNFV